MFKKALGLALGFTCLVLGAYMASITLMYGASGTLLALYSALALLGVVLIKRVRIP